MLNSRVVRMFASLVAVSFFICGQQAFSQTFNVDPSQLLQIMAMPVDPSGNAPSSQTLTPDLHPITQFFGNDPKAPRNAVAGAINPFNADHTLLWPCLGLFSANHADNPDCSGIGSPLQDFPAGGLIVGFPEFSWTVAQCTQANFKACGQVETFYEDDTNDNSDYLVFTFTAKQGDNFVINFGQVVEGPHAIQQFLTPFDIVAAFPTNLFNPGSGMNNGHCLPNINYPVNSTSPTFPFFISDNASCVTPTAGTVTFNVSVSLSTPTFIPTTVGCAAGQTSCFNVKLTPVHTFQMKNDIFLTN